jgi:5-methylcytosine-specific restriction endonuclease McrA
MATDILKRCTICGEHKPISLFSPRKQNKDGLYSWCKPCTAARTREWAAKNKEVVKANNKARYWADPDAARAKRTAYYRAKTGGGPKKPATMPTPDASGVLTLTCSKCKATQPASSFYLRKEGTYSLVCKFCQVKHMSAYVAENRDRVAAYKKQWGVNNAPSRRAKYAAADDAVKAARAEAAKEWRTANPERRAAIAQNYKHRRRAQEDGGISSADLLAWKRAQPKVCYWCGGKCAKGFTVDHYTPLAKGGKHEAENLVIACRPCNAKKNAKDPLEFAQSVGRLF